MILEGEAERRKSQLEEAEGKEDEDDDEEEESSAEEEDVDEAVGSAEQFKLRRFNQFSRFKHVHQVSLKILIDRWIYQP